MDNTEREVAAERERFKKAFPDEPERLKNYLEWKKGFKTALTSIESNSSSSSSSSSSSGSSSSSHEGSSADDARATMLAANDWEDWSLAVKIALEMQASQTLSLPLPVLPAAGSKTEGKKKNVPKFSSTRSSSTVSMRSSSSDVTASTGQNSSCLPDPYCQVCFQPQYETKSSQQGVDAANTSSFVRLVRDRDGHSLLYLLPARINLKRVDSNTVFQILASYLQHKFDAVEEATSRDKSAAKSSFSSVTVTILVDVRPGNGWANESAFKMIAFIRQLTALHHFFPGRLHRCILYPIPLAAFSIWHIIKPFLGSVVHELFVLLPGAAGRNSPIPSKPLGTYLTQDALKQLERIRKEALLTQQPQ